MYRLFEISPTLFHALCHSVFLLVVAWLPKLSVSQFVRSILLLRKVTSIVMRIYVTVMVAKFCH